MILYQIRNKITNDVYMGSTTRPQNRRTQHFSKLRKNDHHSVKLQHAFNKYGEDNFVIELIGNGYKSTQELLDAEQRYIDRYSPAYNMAKNVRNPQYGVKRSKESIDRGLKTYYTNKAAGKHKIRKGKKGTPHSAESRLARSIRQKGIPMKEDQKYLISYVRTKRKIIIYDKETKNKLIDFASRKVCAEYLGLTVVQLKDVLGTKYGHFKSFIVRRDGDELLDVNKTNKRFAAINLVDSFGNVLSKYHSIAQAARELKIHSAGIHQSVVSNCKCNGYLFKYANK